MTAEGYRGLDDRLKQLESGGRPSVISAIAEAREHGDLTENAEYHAAKERQGWIEGQIADIEDRQGSVISAMEIEEAAHRFMLKYCEGNAPTGFMHLDFARARPRYPVVDTSGTPIYDTPPRDNDALLPR